MPSSIILPLLAANFFAFVNLFDKNLKENKFKNNYSYITLISILAIIFLSAILPLVNFQTAYGWPLIFTIISGFLYFLMWIFFWKALAEGEVSRLVALFQVRPIFTSLLAFIFLGESLGFFSWLGIVLIVLGSLICSYERASGKTKTLVISYLFVIFSAFICAAGDIFSKLALRQMDVWGVYYLSSLAVMPIFPLLLMKKEVRKEIKENFNKKTIIPISLRVILGILGTTCFYLAINSGSTGISTAIMGSGPLWVFFYATLLTLFFPNIIKENLKKEALFFKAIAIVLIVSGVILLNF